jgi:hypothetical protein
VKSAIQSDSEPDDMLQDNGSEDEYVPRKYINFISGYQMKIINFPSKI